MRICADLSRLPKVGPTRSVNFRRTTPGSLTNASGTIGSKGFKPRIVPSHPAAHLSELELWRTMPRAFTSAFTLRMVPKAALYVPEPVWPHPPYGLAPARDEASPVVNMSLLKSISAKVYRSAVIRKKVAGKVKLAIRLIVTRGALAEKNEKGEMVMMFDDEDVGKKWIMDAWTYIVKPKPELYRMPLPVLVQQFRDALRSASQKAEQFERTWARAPSATASKESLTKAPAYRAPLRATTKVMAKPLDLPKAENASHPLDALLSTKGFSRKGDANERGRDKATGHGHKAQKPARLRVLKDDQEELADTNEEEVFHSMQQDVDEYTDFLKALDSLGEEVKSPISAISNTPAGISRSDNDDESQKYKDKQLQSDSHSSLSKVRPVVGFKLFETRPILAPRSFSKAKVEQGSNNVTSRQSRTAR